MRTYKSFQALDFNDRYIKKKEHEIHDMHALDMIMIILHMIFVFRYFYMCLLQTASFQYQNTSLNSNVYIEFIKKSLSLHMEILIKYSYRSIHNRFILIHSKSTIKENFG